MADVRIYANNADPKALNQVYELANLEAFQTAKIRIMPDVHAGAGCVIGFTADITDKVIPNIVGVDIGCGVYVEELGSSPINFEELDNFIRENIPHGFAVSPHKTSAAVSMVRGKLKCGEHLRNKDRLEHGIGSLGGGNHFIEIGEATLLSKTKVLQIHTGSRNLGKQVADYYQNLAKEQCKERGISVPRGLEYLTGESKDDYLHDMAICQEYAKLNREKIADEIRGYLHRSKTILHQTPRYADRFHTVHNYIDFESGIVRKGAVSAKEGEKLIIPLNMRDGSLMCVGKGNPDWNYSAPHGAGRLMSRRKAKDSLDLEEFKNEMKDIYTTSVGKSTIDEAPGAYKSMDDIVEVIDGEAVEVLEIIKPLYNFKA